MLFIPKDLHVPEEDPSCQLRAGAGPHGWWAPQHSYRPPAPNAIFHLSSLTVCFRSLIAHHPPGNITKLLHLANGVLELDVRGDFSCLNRNKLQRSAPRAANLSLGGLLIFRT